MLQSAHSSTLPPSVAESRDTSPEQDTDTVVSIKSPLLGEFFDINDALVQNQMKVACAMHGLA